MKQRTRYWTAACAWILIIYSTLYIVRPICNFLKQHLPFEALTSGLVVIPVLGIIFYFFRKLSPLRLSTVLLLCVVISAYVYGIILIKYPEEKIHFIQYGVLAFLVYKALRLDMPMALSYFTAAVLTGLAGWGDEGIQHLLPNRYYDIKDVILNTVSGLMGLSLVWVIERELKYKRALS